MAFKKYDGGKLEWHLMPEEALEEILRVLMLGKKKYGDFNWLDNANEVEFTRYMNAGERHFKRFKRGHDFDVETGLHELAHDIANKLFLLQYQIEGVGRDNRRKNQKEINKEFTDKINEAARLKGRSND